MASTFGLWDPTPSGKFHIADDATFQTFYLVDFTENHRSSGGREDCELCRAWANPPADFAAAPLAGFSKSQTAQLEKI